MIIIKYIVVKVIIVCPRTGLNQPGNGRTFHRLSSSSFLKIFFPNAKWVIVKFKITVLTY